MLKDKLQICLITYNRDKKLNNTFKEILAYDSPIKDFDITVIDNASTDNTQEVIKKYQKNFPNIEYIRHSINIGGNANICRAMEIAYNKNKEYFWIICDDDSYDFSCWNQVEEAIENKKDLILVEYVTKKEDITVANVINECSFLPAGIYKTSNIDSTVMQNAYLNIYNTLPHLAIICNCINKKQCNYKITDKNIVIQNWERGVAADTKRGTNEFIHHKQQHVDLFVGFVNSYTMLNNIKLRYKCNEFLYLGRSFFFSCYLVICNNIGYKPNIDSFFACLSPKQKFIFIMAKLFGYHIYKIKSFLKYLRYVNLIRQQ